MERKTVSEQEASRWFYHLRTHPQLASLVNKVDEFEPDIRELFDEEIRNSESGETVVFLRLQKGEATNYIAVGIFSSESTPTDAELVDLYIEKSSVYSLLAGRGTRWKFEDGEVVPIEWMT